MIRKHITRTLTRSDITAYTVKMVDGTPTAEALPTVTAWGNLTEDEAIKAVKAAHGKNIAVTVGEIKTEDVIYKIDIDKFVANAEIVDKTEDENDDKSEDENDN